jgi:preprotein translocase subunit Sec63
VNRWLLFLVAAVVVLWAVRARWPPRIGSRDGTPTAAAWDPHAVLGVPRDASRETITRGYHEALKRYHPDRVADLGEELQQLAHRKTIELRRAYDELTRTPR